MHDAITPVSSPDVDDEVVELDPVAPEVDIALSSRPDSVALIWIALRSYQQNFASTGATYEEIQPAYRGGDEMRGDSRLANRQWDDVEPQLRQHWETQHPGSACA